jgi:DUF4097 and DUF4098 domain-containing protein YvlB
MAAMRREAFPVEGPVALVVRAPAGVVEIEAAEVSEAVVELEAMRDSAEGPVHDAIVELRPGSDRAELLVDIQHGFRVGGRRGPRLSIVFGQGPSIRAGIRVPAGSSVEVVSEAADVNATGRFDRAEVKTAAGDVRLDEVEGDVRVKCVSGDVTLGTIGGEANVNSVSGDATIGRVAGSAVLHSVSGDIELHEAESSIQAKTISGDVKIGSATQGQVALQSVSGDLTLGLRTGSKLWVNARSTSGKTTSELEVRDEPPANGGPLVELQAKSVSGDIRIHRA